MSDVLITPLPQEEEFSTVNPIAELDEQSNEIAELSKKGYQFLKENKIMPNSSRSLAKRSKRTSPCSLKRIERPLKNTYALTLAPSFKNPTACFNLKL